MKMHGKTMNNVNNNANNNDIILKNYADEMRAFYDFYIDFVVDNGGVNFFNEYLNITNWCEDPELVNMAIIDIKINKNLMKP